MLSATVSAHAELIQTGNSMANGSELPLLCRSEPSIVGISWSDAVFITTNMTISSLAVSRRRAPP